VELRTILPSDRAPLAQMLRRITQFKPEEVAVAEELIDASLRDPEGSGYRCIVAAEGESVLGYICYGPTPMTQATWDLYWIAVSPDAQGKGVGKRLYAAFADQVRAQGGRQVRIETSSQESYAATGGFYERIGFSREATLRDFYADGDDLLIFYRKL
jgi:ribosomal protein S18 acetylase RimI-like enzyme